MQWNDLRSDQIASLDRATPVIVPAAAVEQHGPHLPVCTDATIADAVAAGLDEACGGGLLVTPTLWLGCSAHHRAFAGTLTTGLDAFSQSLFDLVGSVLHQGFTKVLVVNAHGGNRAICAVTLEKLQYAYPEATVVGAAYWEVSGHLMAPIRESGPGGVAHACELETSLMLLLKPELVDMGRAEADGLQPASALTRIDMLGLGDGPGRLVRTRPFDQITRRGVIGDPTLASAEKGGRFLAAIVEGLRVAVDDLTAGRL